MVYRLSQRRQAGITNRNSKKKSKDEIIFLVGPTAIGKSEIAVRLAKKINAEIISCDSMQIYKYMDIITSKPALSLRRKIHHHLINIISPEEEYNVSRYCQDASRKIKEITKRGGIALFVGGTGLYVSMLMDGIFKAGAQNQRIRDRLYKQADNFGSDYLFERLKKIDPQAALKIHPHDTKRIIRALEVFEATGKPISILQKQRRGFIDDYAVRIFCLNLKRDKLYKKIEERVDKMFKQGLVGEVKQLLKLRLSKTAAYAIGVKELKGYFDGSYDIKEAKRLIKRNTRLYAKRQITWFRKDKRIKWVNVNDGEKPRDTAYRILSQWKEPY